MRILVSITTAVLVLTAAFALLAQEPPAQKQPADTLPDDPGALKKIVSEQKRIIDRLIKELQVAKEALESLKNEKAAKQVEKTQTPPSSQDEQVAKKKQPVEGQITQVRMENKRVLVGIGSSKGLCKGDRLEVSRAGRKIGQIKIGEAVYETWCNAEVLKADVDFLPGDKVVKVTAAPKKAVSVEPPRPANPPAEQEKHAVSESSTGKSEDLGKRLEILEGLFADLSKQLKRIEDRLEKKEDADAEEAVRKSAPKAVPEKAERPTDLKTTIADVTKTYVILAAGTDNGLKQGDTFMIKRGDREIAKVRVVKLGTDICRADIISKNEEIQKIRDIAVLQ